MQEGLHELSDAGTRNLLVSFFEFSGSSPNNVARWVGLRQGGGHGGTIQGRKGSNFAAQHGGAIVQKPEGPNTYEYKNPAIAIWQQWPTYSTREPRRARMPGQRRLRRRGAGTEAIIVDAERAEKSKLISSLTFRQS